MNCPICNNNIKELDGKMKSHLFLTKNYEDHIHVHGSLDNKPDIKEFMETITAETGVTANSKLLNKKEIVFHNRQRIGDILMFTCGVRDFKAAYPDVRVNVISTAGHIWDHNPYIDRTLTPTDENTLKIGPGRGTNQSNRIDWHFANAYRISIEDNLGIAIPQGESRPDIWLTDEEYNAPRIFKDPYWVIVVSGEKGWGCKMYPFDRWQEFVNQNKDKMFIQIGAAGDNPPRLKGPNVVDHVGKTENRDTGVRDLFKLFLNAEGSVGLVSFHMHLSGALYKPCVVVAGAREPVHFTRYPGHQYLATDGCLPCAVNACWHCDINACKHLINNVPQCVDIIYPEDLTRAINNYYKGGRLKIGVLSEKPKLKNIVKAPIVAPVVEKKPDPVKEYGLPFNAGTITLRDLEFIKEVIKQNNVKSVLEFGAGLSTLALNDMGLEVTTYETSQGWIDKIKEINPKCDIHLWDGKFLAWPKRKYDMAFVDGPSGGENRELATKIAAEASDIVIVHDASRSFELEWQEKYLKGRFRGPGGGGQRCHLWAKDPKVKIAYRKGSPLYIPEAIIGLKQEPSAIIPTNTIGSRQKFIKVVSTARGWGGCARSVTTILKLLLAKGHKVEFIPFRNAITSREFQECIKNELKGLIVTENYGSISEKCDTFFMYADDYVWEFNKPEVANVFSQINADKKVMMINYRRGPVGQAEWTIGWDKYMFLNSTQETELLKLLPRVKTKVLPPCTDLSEFFKVHPNYNTNLRIVRHSSQGDTKFAKDFIQEIHGIMQTRYDVEFHFMPGPSFVSDTGGTVKKYNRNELPIPKFLEVGNLFWYSLPKGYMDMGPRVILEAMASGLPILADRWGGAVDRVTPECGWLCDNKEDFAKIIAGLTAEELKQKGEAARKRAMEEFVPERYLEELV